MFAVYCIVNNYNEKKKFKAEFIITQLKTGGGGLKPTLPTPLSIPRIHKQTDRT